MHEGQEDGSGKVKEGKELRKLILKGRNGYDIPCLVWEPETPKAVLVFCHGFGGDKNSSVIRAAARRMSGLGYLCLAFDWPGHGKSPASSAELTIDNCLRDLDTVLKEAVRYQGADLSDLPLSIFATSFGAYLVMLYQADHPDLFARIVLRSPALRMPEIFGSFMTRDQAEKFSEGESLNFGFDRPLRLTRSFQEDLLAHPVFDREIPGNPDILIIQGDRDEVVDPEDTAAYAKRNGARLVLVAGADHRYKNPGDLDQILEAAEAFLEEAEAAED